MRFVVGFSDCGGLKSRVAQAGRLLELDRDVRGALHLRKYQVLELLELRAPCAPSGTCYLPIFSGPRVATRVATCVWAGARSAAMRAGGRATVA